MAFKHVWIACVASALAGAAQAGPLITRGPVRLAFNIAGLGQGPEVTQRGGRLVVTIRPDRIETRLADPATDHDADGPLRPRLPGYAMMGDIYPLGTGLRLSAGVREDDNRRLLRGTAIGSTMVRSVDPAGEMAPGDDIGTRQYAPVMTVGYAGEIADGFVIGADIGMALRGSGMGSASMITMPIDDGGRGAAAGRARRIIQMSAGYRF